MYFSALAEDAPQSSVRWFYALDAPIKNLSVYKKNVERKPRAAPQKWQKFSKSCSAKIEEAYQNLQQWQRNHQQGMNKMMLGMLTEKEPPHIFSVNEDLLYEVDVKRRELRPIYWPGEVYEVRRGTWFYAEDGGKYHPCDESLTQQLEIGYKKFQPWRAGNSVASSSSNSLPTAVKKPASADAGPKEADVSALSSSTNLGPALTSSIAENLNQQLATAGGNAEEKRWTLLGPYINSYVVYANSTQAWMLSDMLTSKISRALLGRWSNGENLGGTRLIRGWKEIKSLQKNSKKFVSVPLPVSSSSTPQTTGKESETSEKSSTAPEVKANEAVAAESSDDESDCDQERPIEHLILVVHGIGQRWGTRMDSVGLIHDVAHMRTNFKICAKQFFPIQPVTTQDAAESSTLAKDVKRAMVEPKHWVPRGSGVQVLPIQWRHRLGFDARMQRRDDSAQSACGSDTESDADSGANSDVSSKGRYSPDPSLSRIGGNGHEDVANAQAGQRAKTPRKKYPVFPLYEDRATLGDVTLEGVPMIRNVISDVGLDVLLYMAPEHRQSMIVAVTSELNWVYKMFKKRNPNFSGKVSIYAHSLGSLIAFDILCHQRETLPVEDLETMFAHLMSPRNDFYTANKQDAGATLSDGVAQSVDLVDKSALRVGEKQSSKSFDPDRGDPLGWVQNFGLRSTIFGKHSKSLSTPHGGQSGSSIDRLQYGQLLFDVHSLFTVGSPLGLFLVLENKLIRSFATYHEDNVELDRRLGVMRPKCNALYNIFHPMDPIAYRLEPHVHCELGKMRPVTIAYTKPGFTNAMFTIQDLSTDLSSKGRSMLESVFGSFAFSAASVAGIMGSWGSTSATNDLSLEEAGNSSDEEPTSQEKSNADHGRRADAKAAIVERKHSTKKSKRSKLRETVMQDAKKEIKLLNPKGRLDFSIQKGLLENDILSSLGSHMSYWKDSDVNVFILRELFNSNKA